MQIFQVSTWRAGWLGKSTTLASKKREASPTVSLCCKVRHSSPQMLSAWCIPPSPWLLAPWAHGSPTHPSWALVASLCLSTSLSRGLSESRPPSCGCVSLGLLWMEWVLNGFAMMGKWVESFRVHPSCRIQCRHQKQCLEMIYWPGKVIKASYHLTATIVEVHLRCNHKYVQEKKQTKRKYIKNIQWMSLGGGMMDDFDVCIFSLCVLKLF